MSGESLFFFHVHAYIESFHTLSTADNDLKIYSLLMCHKTGSRLATVESQKQIAV